MAEQDILLKCKSTIEDLETQLNGERGRIRDAGRERDRLERELDRARDRERQITGIDCLTKQRNTREKWKRSLSYRSW